MTERHREYWRKNLTVTGMLLVAWAGLCIGTAYFARELRDVAGVMHAAVVCLYAWYVKRQDRLYGGPPDEA